MGPTSPYCPDYCPAQCNEEEIVCSGGYDAEGCPRPDFCIPAIVNECQAYCPAACHDEYEMSCPGGVDADNCPLPDTCVHVDPYAKGQTFCPVNRPPGEALCNGGLDSTGYPM